MAPLSPPREDAASAWEALWPILLEDAQHAEQEARSLGTSASRRTAFRTLFACLEGAIWLKKLIPLSISDTELKYSLEEIALLREETYVLASNGAPKKSKRFLRIEENLLFTIRMVAKLEDIDPEIDLSAEGWRALKDSIRVRNRVTHPRTTVDLDVSEKEFEQLIVGYKWAVHSLEKALAKSYLKLHARSKLLLKHAEELKIASDGAQAETKQT